ncbi:MAG: MBOAT family protein [Desulfuromonadaceae bacterium]|nr:MBOAT family protein [Desulfuromonadaceae bacterium]
MRNAVLLLASFYFYSIGNILYLIFFIVFLILNYYFGSFIDKNAAPATRLKVTFVSVTVNLIILFIFKYLGFFLGILNSLLVSFNVIPLSTPQIPIPLGLSFLVFQAIAYQIDIYRQEIEPECNVLKFSLAFALFPKLVAGPIVRMDQIEVTLEQPSITMEDFIEGFKRVVIGLGKKLILADTLAKTADQIFAIPPHDLTTPVAWLGIVCYTLQLYFDFSGYTDMAIGLGRLFGYTLPENFNYPYAAKSLTEFWRRWHISLSTWFRDYLYIPLSYALMTDKVRQKIVEGKYKTNYRALYSIVVVFTLCGLWHGANWNFVIWGMLHGVILALESWKFGKILKKCWTPLSHIYLVLIVMLCWVFFRIPIFIDAVHFVQTLTGLGSAGTGLSQLREYATIELLLVLSMALCGTLPVITILKNLLEQILPKKLFEGTLGRQLILCAEAIFLAFIFLTSMQAVIGSVSKPFIYAQF